MAGNWNHLKSGTLACLLAEARSQLGTQHVADVLPHYTIAGLFRMSAPREHGRSTAGLQILSFYSMFFVITLTK